MKRDYPVPSEMSAEARATLIEPRVTTLETASAEPVVEWLYRGPRWLPTGHAQTIVPALFARLPAVAYRRERWTTPDGDFIDLDWLADDSSTDSARGELAKAPLFV